MILINNRKNREREDAVSPVVGVMLMLVVTIIIAAVVSAFSGGLIGGNNQKTPTLAMDVSIANTGSAATSGFSAKVLSISEPTTTKNLKISTSWVTTIKDTSVGTVGSSITGGATTTAKTPVGFGPGVVGDTALNSPYTGNQTFGNYTLTQGTGLIAEPASGYASFDGESSTSDLSSVLGSNWNQLRTGDTVTIRVIYIPTGKTMFEKDVAVTGV